MGAVFIVGDDAHIVPWVIRESPLIDASVGTVVPDGPRYSK